MFSTIIFLIVIVLILAAVIWILFFSYTKTILAPANQQSLLGSVCIRGNCFSVELAQTEAQRDTGLMNRKSLDKNKGMLFIFGEVGFYPFWMKNTLIPLDMIWIGADKKIVFISENAQPCKILICPVIVPLAKAEYVLEINAGVVSVAGLKVGDDVSITY